jgi:hypothetical protein
VVLVDITPYVESLRRDLLAAAESAGPEARELAERLGFALDPAARLAMMEAVSQAASEITAEMAAGSVDVRLDGRDLAFVVDSPATPPPPPEPPAPSAGPAEPEEGNVVRITLRLPEGVKARAEELAARSGHSLNTWLVNAVRSATSRDGAVEVDLDLSSLPLGGGRTARRMTGWI